MKKFIALGIVLILALTLAACGAKGGKKDSIVGTWVTDTDWLFSQEGFNALKKLDPEFTAEEYTEMQKLYTTLPEDYLSKACMTFNADGTGTIVSILVDPDATENDITVEEITYTAENGKLTIQYWRFTDTLDYSLKNGRLILAGIQYKRK